MKKSKNSYGFELTSGDTTVIAQTIGCTDVIVRRVLGGGANDKPTFLHLKILKVAEQRSTQNVELKKFAEGLKVENILLK